jgi:hypothetical protein
VNTATVEASGYDPIMPNNTDKAQIAVLSNNLTNIAATGDRRSRGLAGDGASLVAFGAAIVLTTRRRRRRRD